MIMNNKSEYINKITRKLSVFLVGMFLALQVVGELLEFYGKAVPEFVKIRKYFARKKMERETLKQIPDTLREVQEFLDKDNREIQKAKDALEDMREARKHANYEDFFKFSESMESTQEWLDAEDWSRAGSMLDYLNQCIEKALDYILASLPKAKQKERATARSLFIRW